MGLGPYATPAAEARSAYLPSWRAEQLARDRHLTVRTPLASNPRCSATALSLLSKDRSMAIRLLVAKHPATSPEALTALVQDVDANVRWSAAGHNRLPQEVLAALAQGEDDGLRQVAVENTSCPADALLALLQRVRAYAAEGGPAKFGNVRQAIAAHRNCPKDDLQVLKDPQWAVRAAAAANPASGEVLLRALAQDEHEFVRACLAENSACPPDVLQMYATSGVGALVRRAVVHPATPPEARGVTLPKLDLFPRCELARHPHLPLHLMRQLAQDVDPRVRQVVAENSQCPADILWGLRNDAPAILNRVVSNPNCPPVLIEDMKARLRRHAGTPEGDNRAELLAVHRLPASLFEVLAEVGPLAARQQLAENQDCPTEVLQSLVGDPNPDLDHRARHWLRMRTGQQAELSASITAWDEEVAPYGHAVEQVAWAMACASFGGTLSELAAIAVGTVA